MTLSLRSAVRLPPGEKHRCINLYFKFVSWFWYHYRNTCSNNPTPTPTPRTGHSNRFYWRLYILRFLMCFTWFFSSMYFLEHSFCEYILCYLLNGRDKVWHPYTTTGEVTVFYTEYYPSHLALLDFWKVMSIFIISYYLTIFMITIATCYSSSKRFIAYSKDFIHRVSSTFWRQEVKIIKFQPGMLIHIVWQRSGANRIRKRENTRRIPWSTVQVNET